MSPTYARADVESDRVVTALSGEGWVLEGPHRHERTVLDTFDGRLHRAGLRLEHRAGRGRSALVLQADDGGPPAVLVVESVPRWPHELPSGPFRTRIATVTDDRALLPVLSVRSTLRNLTRLDARAVPLVDVEVHDGLSVDGQEDGPPVPWLAEIVARPGHDGAAEQAAALLEGMDLRCLGADVMTVLAGTVGASLHGHDTTPRVELEASEEALVGYRRVLRNLAGTIEATIPGVLTDVDAEFLHDLRVAVRRTRSVLAEGKAVLPPAVRAPFRDLFRRLGHTTGPARDLDVYLLGWGRYTAPVSDATPAALDRVRAELEVRRQEAHEALTTILRSPHTREGLDEWRRWLEGPDTPTGGPLLGPVVTERIAHAQRTVLTDGRAIGPDSPAEHLHELRKEAKRLRYLLECFASLFPSKAHRAFVAQLKELQDNLGEHQDAEVHLAYLRELAQDLHHRANVDTDTLLAMGRLTHHIDRRRRQERRAFVERFAGYDTKGNAKSLRRLLEAGAG